MDANEIEKDVVEREYARLRGSAEAGSYHLNPDIEFTKDLVNGLIVNERRYGYPSCPCRLASGTKEKDLDVICPCDYRDADVAEFDACYCGLYVSKAVIEGRKQVRKIPERRPVQRKKAMEASTSGPTGLPYTVWRCRVCGYLCARDAPPDECPVCRARKERFEAFIVKRP